MRTRVLLLACVQVSLLCTFALGQMQANAPDPRAAISSQATHATIDVIVLHEPRLPYRGVAPGASPERLAERLREFGLTAETRISAQIRSGALNEACVFVSLYGNSYPELIESKLEAFKFHGGSIVATGIPFSTPFEPGRVLWRDQKPNPEFMQKMAFGRPAGPVLVANDLAVSAAGKRIGLDQFKWSQLNPSYTRYLDVASLPAGDTCRPLLSVPSADGTVQPIAALIQRGDNRAPDAWALNLTLHDEGGINREAPYIEIVARVVALVCDARGLIDLNAKPLPPVPANLQQFAQPQLLTPIRATPRPNANDIYPNAKSIAPTLLVADTRNWRREERVLARSIQGLANREVAQLWLHQKKIDPFWLEWLKKRGDIQQTEQILSFQELLERFKPAGAAVFDPHQRHTYNIATMIAGVEGLIVATPELAEKYHLEIKEDLRGRFKTNVEAYRWAFDNLWPKMSHQVLACVVPSPNITLQDYLIAQKVFTFWISGWVDEQQPGCDREQETRLLAELLQQMPVNIPVLGYPHAGDGIGIQERQWVNLFSRTGKFLVPSDYMPNLSVLSATKPVALLKQPPPREIPLEDDKVYVTLTMSDGDNLNVYYDWFIDDWRSPQHGQVPMGWTLGPSAIDFYPAVVDWYYQHLNENIHIQCAVSGIGYTYPDHYGAAFVDRERVFGDFCLLTDEYMRRLDQRTLWLMGASEPAFTRLSEEIPTLLAQFSDYRYLAGTTRENANLMAGGKPVFHVLADGTPRELGDNLIQAVGDQRPAFVHAFLFNWDWRLSDVAKLAEQLPEDYVFVRPDELTQLFLKSQSE